MKKPNIHESVFVADGARIIGDVTIGEDASVWYNAVIRADNNTVVIGARSNVQDGCVLHESPDAPLTIGSGVGIGHGAVVHGCTIGDDTLIGMGAVILNKAQIGKGCIVGAGTLITGGMTVPDGMLVLGNPGKIVRPVTEKELEKSRKGAEIYVNKAKGAMQERNLTGE